MMDYPYKTVRHHLRHATTLKLSTDIDNDTPPDAATDSPLLDSPQSSRSRPIAIEFPTTKKVTSNGSSVYTPPAPLSARGDLPGGYFPLHEKQPRVYRSHPFHLDASKARKRSIQRASQSSSPEAQVLLSAPTVPGVLAPAPSPPATAPMLVMPESVTMASPANTAMSTTPVTSYIPSGVHANPLPMGKYYPSNYESRKAAKREQQQQGVRPTSSGSSTMAATRSDSQIPMYRGDSPLGHSRNESEAKRRLQQYQRDMIAQATLVLNSGNINAAGLNASSLRNMGFNSVATKPSKPRLAPLGSPGPVTPMDLESGDDGYLGARVPGSNEAAQVEEIARAIRADGERRRREGANSPAVEAGPIF
ncbi:uncharacterized protein BCR38DRAFT_158463 [Pseudomassariella vexata]|uniref:Uncharacterized protein n=1 Tax=Pseudomassariella vexata TaxID=1141098 RepID=A0A1Y2E7D5_9PEZI|nr:uncharacterized protein BCR38DRAFT_158463 [Pseudomassariella vexata]ORY67450.1 hypothetical protein BCR38DRAFT_158463 [Pseudomassariella vexata]